MLRYATTDSLGYYKIIESIYDQFSYGDYYIKPYIDPPTNQIVIQPQYIKVDLDEQHQWVENIDFTRIFDTGFVKPDSVNLSITQGQTVKFAFTLQSTWGTNYIFDGYPTSVGSQLKFVPTSAQISEGGTAMIYLNADSAVSPGIYIGNQVLKNGEAPSLPVEFPVSITVNPALTPTPTATPTPVPTPNCSFVGTQSASLRQGVSGYFGVEDTYLIKDVEAPADESNPIPTLSKYIKIQDFYPKFRGLIGYNLSNLPINEDIKIDRAKLIINTIQWDGVANKQINIANLRKTFSETFANWTFANKLNSYSWGGLGASLTQGADMDYSLSYASSAGWGANTIDVTTQAQEWFTNKNNSHFDILLFANDSSSKWLASSENTDISKRPQLDIQYSCLDYKPNPTPTPTPIADCNFTEQRELVLQQGLDNYLGTQDTYISSVIEDSQTVPVRALSQNIKVENWWQYLNGLLSFDLYGMPKENGIVIDEASLKLWVVAWGGVQGQVEFSRIIKPFDEYFSNWSLANKTLSWSNAGASGLNADIVLSQTQAITWGENTINAKTLVENWFQNRDSNQFAIRLNAPMISGVPRLGDSFASSNYSDVNKRPKLTIKYSCNN